MMDGGWMWIWPVLILAGLVIIGYAVVRPIRTGQSSSPPGSGLGTDWSARRILDERFARGEIDEDEYRRQRDLLQ
jgi:putative membrane protein